MGYIDIQPGGTIVFDKWAAGPALYMPPAQICRRLYMPPALYMPPPLYSAAAAHRYIAPPRTAANTWEGPAPRRRVCRQSSQSEVLRTNVGA